MTIRCAVDIGGTFTDVVAFDETTGMLTFGKALSTPADLIDGVAHGLAVADLAPSEVALMIHGSTIVVNALIERRGSRTALLTTAGFRDLYEIGRINRPDAFNLSFVKHTPLVPRSLVFEVDERVAADGSVVCPLDDDAVRDTCRRLRVAGVESIAVVLLHAYRNPTHERRLGELLAEELPGCYVTLSHQISREYREYERTSTTAANAFVGPVVSDYLGRLQQRLRVEKSEATLAIMQSNGGVCDVAKASQQCVHMLESGPAGGVVGTIAMCERLGLADAIAFDMGGTTAKSAVIRNGMFPIASDYFLGGYTSGLPIRIPCLDIVEVGTGGGSIAWLDDVGGVHVGPQSAGAEPGPACYGTGGNDATITDATVVLGHLPPDGRLVGGVPLNSDAAHAAVGTIGRGLGIETVAAAGGIVAIGAAAMANSIRAVTTERGLDPREFTVVAFGGNGPLHISLIARELGITRVVIPPYPALFSAVGMLHADARADVVQTGVRMLSDTSADDLEASFRVLENDCELTLKASSVGVNEIRFDRAADMRYVGQEHAVTVQLPPRAGDAPDLAEVKQLFDVAHQERFSHSAPREPCEIVSLRVTAIGVLGKPAFETIAVGESPDPSPARVAERAVVFAPDAGPELVPVYRRASLCAGHRLSGPAVIEEPTATTLVRPGDTVEVDIYGNLMMEVGS